MAPSRSDQARVAPLLLLGGAICLGLGVAAWLMSPERPAEPRAPSLQDRVDSLDLARAADLAAVQLERARDQLGPALMPGQEQPLAQLLRLQAESADMALGTVDFVPGARDGYLRVVGLELEVEGAYYDLPIFVDGLFRQRHAVRVHRMTIESVGGPGSARIRCRLEAELARPVEVPEDSILDSVSAVQLDASERAFTTTALSSAAQLQAYEGFLARLPQLLDDCQANRKLVMRTIPRLIRTLPGSPMQWVGATFEGGEAKLAME
jgi:hypothetical protein